MRVSLYRLAWTLAIVWAATGCDSSAGPSATASGRSPSGARASLVPTAIATSRGQHTGTAPALAAADLDGSVHDPAREVVFTPAAGGYIGEIDLALPGGLPAESLAEPTLDVRYAGPARAGQQWLWQVRDACAGTWRTVGQNSNAGGGAWTRLSFDVPIGGACLASDGRVRVRYRTGGSAASALDQLVLGYAPPDAPPDGDWWRPAPGTSWQWQLQGALDRSFDVDMYDIDLFETSQADIAALHADGRIVVCYFSAGSYENVRPDAGAFPAAVLGRRLDGWPGEKWLDIRALDVLGPIMQARLDLAVAKGCDGVEPDNVDGYANRTGFPLTGADQLAYNRWVAAEAHARGLSVGLKNDLDQIPDLVGDFDWALNEQCHQYDECDALTPFVEAGKAVFGVEYRLETGAFCPQANAMDFDFLKKPLSLKAPREACR